MSRRSGPVRATLLAVAVGWLVAGASLSSWSVQLASPQAHAGVPRTSHVLVEDAGLICPGQDRAGAPGLRDVPGTVRVSVAAPPLGVVPGLKTSAAGTVGVAALPGGSTLVSAADRARSVAVSPQGSPADALSAQAAGALAPGLVAAQTWLRQGDDDRGLAVTACSLPASDLWLLGGSAGPSRLERVVLTNPGANAVSARLEVLGAKGAVPGAGDRAVSIAPRSRTVVSLDALAPDEGSPAVHVIASGGVVAGVLVDSWIDGATGRGMDVATPSAPPAKELVIAGVDPAGSAILRLANPGDVEALTRVVLLTSAGGVQPEPLRVVRVPARSTLDVPLPGSTAGMSGVRIVSDRALTAGAWVERRAASGNDRMGDFGWAPATPPVRGLAGLSLPGADRLSLSSTLELAAGPAGGVATVTTSTRGAVSSQTLTLGPDSAKRVPLGQTDLVWVAPSAGALHAAVTVSAADADGPLYSVVALDSAPVTVLSLPVRQLGG